ncbi:hypothetical protein FFF93_003770 [Arthrobacter sp. KBS0702]|uniref:hypothetical protein n=1 Tax=Arthrobacter sp. KBS0702 TaxID=2578107 RepID=UPI00110D7252|nr:hypothetical protein [Arthrobacter sp. KBS0702]QDW28994.1 hypothetical protein FFF93_003770 [Arthrobacter sp. KBS0702]
MRRTASLATVGSAACFAVVLLAGCGSPAAAPATGSSPAPTPSVTSSASPTSASASPTAASQSPASTAPASTAPAGWKSFTTGDGTLTFNYPEKWTINDAAPGASGAAVDVLTDYGKTIASLRTGVVTGAQCTDKMPFMQYDTAPVPALAQNGTAPRFVFEARTDRAASDPAKATMFAYGLTSEPEPTGTEACPMTHFFNWPPSGATFGGVYDPFDTTPGGPMHVDSPEAYKDTTEYQWAKQMIMSLRPAGK